METKSVWGAVNTQVESRKAHHQFLDVNVIETTHTSNGWQFSVTVFSMDAARQLRDQLTELLG